ncbi:AzlD domain-containing protein [Acinetobacter rudis]|uniref:AzlD domain-containing protein n=1 Tax=Acinetobacter rudis TaxID=632955 RepID=UPI00280D87F7|nr:AzlD domain-containing protein [Acinetobacter rudis]MDQ8952476.1 AzlD domain-containing protein [Acinetobacter rudis]
MSWIVIVAMSILVFFNRYLFLEPRIGLKLPHPIQRMLHYSAPCLLTAMCVPVIFYDAQQFRPLFNNAYLYAALATSVFYLTTKHLLASAIFGFIIFYLLFYWVFAN